jgi:hypothetical protein
MKYVCRVSVGFVLVMGLAIPGVATDNSQPVTVKGYVLDSACAFTKHLDKPISRECAMACAKAGSPLVILSDEGNIYWPIANTVPVFRPERKAAAVRRAQGNGQRQGVSAGWLHGHRDRED